MKMILALLFAMLAVAAPSWGYPGYSRGGYYGGNPYNYYN